MTIIIIVYCNGCDRTMNFSVCLYVIVMCSPDSSLPDSAFILIVPLSAPGTVS